jgi:multidrug resistance efflux pump
LPRQIIDTESSRPAYVRRRARRFVVTLVVVVALVVAGWLLAHYLRGQESSPPRGTSHAASLPLQKGVSGEREPSGEKNAA